MGAIAFTRRVNMQDVPTVSIQQLLDLSLAFSVRQAEVHNELRRQVEDLAF